MAISVKELNSCIKNSKPIYHDGYEFVPTKIGTWNKIKLVEVEINNLRRVIDYEFLIRNFTTKDMSF